ncbi:MAG: LysR family transcriptional regulator [Lentisphaeria bacterium]|nr:LysR family transcriptional regulator [Lentisphaeria bacterium]
MELTALRYFAAVAEELHFRRAAAKLHITQAPLSAAVKKLESELGIKLFERTSRSVKLTAAGTLFLQEAKAVLDRAELARKRLEEISGINSSTLSIGYNEPALNTFLPDLLRRCRSHYPEMQLKLRELETGEQLELLRRGDLDIGFMRPFGFDISEFSSRLICREEYRLVMPDSHHLAARDVIRCSDLSGKEVILFAREVNPAIFDRITDSLSPHGIKPPKFRQYARNKSSMLALVHAGFGAALMPESCCQFSRPGVIAKKILAPLPEIEIMAVWNKNNTFSTLQDLLSALEHHTIR